MPEKRWILAEENIPATLHLMEVLNVSRPVANILAARNVNGYDDAKAYFRPTLEMLHDPFEMAGMADAVDRLIAAINRNERILVYGDYDVDGTTAVAMFYHFLSSFYDQCDYYIPNRYTQGYGVSLAGIQYAAENDFTLIVTLDCGIKSNDLVKYAGSKNIDFIICDHHEPDAALPDAIAVLDPKRNDCHYPYKELSGCGVGFKLIQAFLTTHPGINFELFSLLDLVCVSIAADIVPITGENRVLAYYGLERLRQSPRPGLASLMEIAGIATDQISIMRIVFGLAPRINAAGRLEDARHAVDLMLSSDKLPAAEFARKLDSQNAERKDIDRQITIEAHEMIENRGWQDTKTTVLYHQEWHKGVIGIVASRCIETYYRPTVILTRTEDGMLTGSARSVEGFDLYSALTKCSDLLEQFGGHKHAAGMKIRNENLDAFRLRFEDVVAEAISPDMLTPAIYIDTVVRFDEINAKFIRILKQMAPFGPGNPEPVLVAHDLQAVRFNAFSARNNPESSHLRMTVSQKGARRTFEAIGFNLGSMAELIRQRNGSFGMAFAVGENTYRGQTSLQLYIKDIRWE